MEVETYPRAFLRCRSVYRSTLHRIVMVEVIIRVMIKDKCQSVLAICLHLVLDHIQEMGKLLLITKFSLLNKITDLVNDLKIFEI